MTIKDEITKPINLIFLALTIASIILSVYFYFLSRKVKEISYKIETPISKIYDNNNASTKIKLTENNGNEIKENVYLITGTIWNSGDLPIDILDVRQSLEISLPNNSCILDYKIIKQNIQNIAQFELLLPSGSKNKLAITWKYFDPKYGLRFQIIIKAPIDPSINITGKILGIDKFVDMQPKSTFLSNLFSLALGALFSLFTTGLFTIPQLVENKKKSQLAFIIIGFIVTLTCLVLYIFRSSLFSNGIPF